MNLDREQVERELIRSIFRTPSRGSMIASLAGVTYSSFLEVGLGIVFLALCCQPVLDEAQFRGRLAVIRRCLRESGLWSDDVGAVPSQPPAWNEARLIALTESGRIEPDDQMLDHRIELLSTRLLEMIA